MSAGIDEQVKREQWDNEAPLSSSVAEVKPHHQLLAMLIEHGQYERAFALLHGDLLMESNVRDSPLFSHILATANYLFNKCQRYHDEVEWYQQAFLKAQQQEHEIQKELDLLR